uniref:hypothetical protein n=1 Tax=Clostridium botulinum TaxID=1491 RepID=UPI00155DD28A|nr:hypothetical protein [Clostridium botulinum]
MSKLKGGVKIMFLKKRLINNTFYWSLVESYREEGKVKQKIIKNLGNTEKALNFLNGNNEYNEYLEKINRFLENSTNKNIIVKSPSKIILKNSKRKILQKMCRINFKYLAIRKQGCIDEEIKLTHRSLETIVEMGRDYVNILNFKLEKFEDDECYLKAMYSVKAKEIQQITDYMAEE